MDAVFPEDFAALRSHSCHDPTEPGADRDDSGLGLAMRRHSGCVGLGFSCIYERVRRNSRPAQDFSSAISNDSLGVLDNRDVVGWNSEAVFNSHTQPLTPGQLDELDDLQVSWSPEDLSGSNALWRATRSSGDACFLISCSNMMAVPTSMSDAETRNLLKSAIPCLDEAGDLGVDVALDLSLGLAGEQSDSEESDSEIIDNGRPGKCVATATVTLFPSARLAGTSPGDVAGDKVDDIVGDNVEPNLGDEAGGKAGDVAGE
jgi:hypothetical protein